MSEPGKDALERLLQLPNVKVADLGDVDHWVKINGVDVNIGLFQAVLDAADDDDQE